MRVHRSQEDAFRKLWLVLVEDMPIVHRCYFIGDVVMLIGAIGRAIASVTALDPIIGQGDRVHPCHG